ncbi:hypothetical protein [Embleya sp. NPDC059259]|uniref:hypothetical protein n=1 Tax=unclassified Embleya TaxID=2699296 RepID=UPI0036B1A241
MITQGARFTEDCGHCGGVVEGWFAQFMDDEVLHWAVDRCCGSCGVVIDDEGVDPAPDFVREAILAEHAARRLVVGDSSRAKVQLLKAFRAVSQVDLRTASTMTSQAMASGWSGTHLEVEFLASILRNAGVAGVAVEVVSPPLPAP